MDNTVRSAGDNIADALPRAGEIVAGKYRVESVIGTGGMGVVMGAQDTSLGRAVAIKFLSPAKARREGAVARFVREARAAASIQSEHVVRVFEVGTLPTGAPFIVMEHLRGCDLAQLLGQRGPLPFEDGVDFILQACEALGEAHGRGIVHRDLKPQNLFLTQRPDGGPCIKVLDFGISKANDEDAPNLTATDTVMGTPLYMSPEQVRSLKNVDQRADIWALGSILFELVTASPIFQAPSATALCAMIAMDPPTPLRARRPEAPPGLEAAILRCLHKDPAGRFQDVAALAEGLGPFASERGRASAARISRVVRASAVPFAGPGFAGAGSVPPAPGSGTTMDASGPRVSNLPPHLGPSGYPPPQAYGPSGFPPGVAGGSAYPPQHVQSGPHTTQDTWQRTGETGIGAPASPRRGAGPVLVALLGMLTGLVFLGLAVGAWVIYSKRVDAAQLAEQGADAASPSKPATTTTSAPGAAAPASAATTPRPGQRPAAAVDGGVVPPNAAKDGGAPVTPPGPGPGPAPPKKDPDLDAKKRTAEGRCSHMRFLLSGNDPKTNSAATQVKQMECLQSQSLSSNSGAANCDRQICRSACSMLNDQECIRQLEYAEHNNPLPY